MRTPDLPQSPGNYLPRGMLALLLHPWLWRMAWRDSRRERKRLVVFASSIVIGVCALVTIHALRASLERGIELQARELLGSDLQIEARQGMNPESLQIAFGNDVEVVDFETNFTSMLRFPDADAARLVQVRSSRGLYPFYGGITTEHEQAWQAMELSQPAIFLEPALLEQFGIAVGDTVILGELEIAVTGSIEKSAPRIGRFAGFAPGVHINAAALEASGLLSRTSLTRHYAHLRLSEGVNAEALITRLQEQFPNAGYRFETPESRREQLGEILDRFEQFLALIALFSLVLGAIGVASAMQAQVKRRQKSIAILRCLGAPPKAAFGIYWIQASILGLFGSLIGAALACLFHIAIVGFFQDALPVALALVPEGWVVLRTTFFGFLTCIGFALIPLLEVRRIPPLAVLRAAEGTSLIRGHWRERAPVILLLFALLTGLSALGGAGIGRALLLSLGFVLVFLILVAIAIALIFGARHLGRSQLPYLVRQGISNLFRPNNQTLVFVVSLGLGVFLLSLTVLLRALIMDQVATTSSRDGPSLFLVDVQPDQVNGVQALLQSKSLPVLESAPMVTMRLSAINGISGAELRQQGSVPDWIIRREFRSSYRDHLNDTETERSGQWPPLNWNGEEPVPLSLEIGLAEDLNVSLGDELLIDVQGLPILTKITHLREVDWSRFNLNFFMLFPPGVLEGAPGFHVVTSRMPEGQTSGQLQAAVATEFQNISVIDLSSILETVQTILSRISQAVRVLSFFTLAAGLCILVGIFLNGREQRSHEAVLLRTLGSSTRQLQTIFCVEFGLLGILAATAGGALAIAAYYPIAHFGFSLTPVFPMAGVLGLIGLSGAISVFMGSFLSKGIRHASPLALLRAE